MNPVRPKAEPTQVVHQCFERCEDLMKPSAVPSTRNWVSPKLLVDDYAFFVGCLTQRDSA